jgi:hypothetical protein
MRKRSRSGEAIEVSSGKVFADLDLPDAVELDTKVRLAVASLAGGSRRLALDHF